ncbi:UNKNOWN [Stylonychia lemnae]|uniref:Potassium channel domain-containing protein n=1 Tax=Stylonychia lemnae TaxID=5949 RepID=A0A078B9B6_STYLE|nr:UNKNOWN [Stylonychia lemnae]|eukprot:CDW91110.1 UNKNOWN [Stylonychia lemnae]
MNEDLEDQVYQPASSDNNFKAMNHHTFQNSNKTSSNYWISESLSINENQSSSKQSNLIKQLRQKQFNKKGKSKKQKKKMSIVNIKSNLNQNSQGQLQATVITDYSNIMEMTNENLLTNNNISNIEGNNSNNIFSNDIYNMTVNNIFGQATTTVVNGRQQKYLEKLEINEQEVKSKSPQIVTQRMFMYNKYLMDGEKFEEDDIESQNQKSLSIRNRMKYSQMKNQIQTQEYEQNFQKENKQSAFCLKLYQNAQGKDKDRNEKFLQPSRNQRKYKRDKEYNIYGLNLGSMQCRNAFQINYQILGNSIFYKDPLGSNPISINMNQMKMNIGFQFVGYDDLSALDLIIDVTLIIDILLRFFVTKDITKRIAVIIFNNTKNYVRYLKMAKLVKIGVLYYLIFHCLALIWIFLERDQIGEPIKDGWLEYYYPNGINYDNYHRIYRKSFYFIVATFTTVGYGDIYGTNNREMLFTVCLILIVQLLFSFFLQAFNVQLLSEDSSQHSIPVFKQEKKEMVELLLMKISKTKGSKPIK